MIQNDFETVCKKLRKKRVNEELIEKLRVKSLDLKSKKAELEPLQAEQNTNSKLVGIYAKEKRDVTDLKEKLTLNKGKIATLNKITKDLEDELTSLAMVIPNLPDDAVPEGLDEDGNIEIKKVLNPPVFSFIPKEHWDLDVTQNWIDFERGVKVSKSRFSVLKNQAAKLERALINYMLDFNAERGFHEVAVPYIVNRETLEGTGQLPKFEEDLFKIDGEELFLIPTAEVPLTNLYREEILSSDELPIKMTSYTACFRKEAGSAGRDTRGMIRQHQFDKVELVCISKPEDSDSIFDEMVSCASDLLTSLGLAHRHLMLCGGDLGFSAAKTIDLEVWFPGQNRYREISSISNTRDFQARRAKIRYKNDKKNILVHTLNGSSLAVGRTMIAIMENFQNEDGSITIPSVLERYM